MRLNIFPKDEKFFQKFDEQAELILRICDQFDDLLKQWPEGDIQTKVDEINRTEHEADDLLHDISLRLARTFVTPIDREDIHLLANHLDDIVDLLQGAANRMNLFQVGAVRPRLLEMSAICKECAAILIKGVSRLPKFEELTDLRKELRELETRADRINREAIAELFADCQDVEGVKDLLKWKEIIENTERAVDRFEDAFDVLESVLIKHA